MRIIISCVNYNTPERLISYIDSLDLAVGYSKSKILITVLIADNSDATFDLPDRFHNLDIIHLFTYKNLGYLGAVQFALLNTKIEISSYDFFIISNVDIKVKLNFFSTLSGLNLDKNIGWIAPRIYSLEENRDRNPKIRLRPSKRKIDILIMMYKYPVLYKIYTSFIYQTRKKHENIQSDKIIYAGHGSMMIFTKTFVEKHSNFDFPSFLFGEEIFFAELNRKSGLEVIYVPEIGVVDADHASTSKLSRKIYCHMNYESLKKLKNLFYYE